MSNMAPTGDSMEAEDRLEAALDRIAKLIGRRADVVDPKSVADALDRKSVDVAGPLGHGGVSSGVKVGDLTVRLDRVIAILRDALDK